MRTDKHETTAAWLMEKMTSTRRYIVQVVGRIDRLALVAAFGPGKAPARAKLARWLAELSNLKRDETAMLARIEAVEGRHRKGLGRLPADAPSGASKAKDSDSSLLFWLLLWVIWPRLGLGDRKPAPRALGDGPRL